MEESKEQSTEQSKELNNWYSVVKVTVNNNTSETICIRFEYEDICREFHNSYSNFLSHPDLYQIVRPDIVTIDVYELEQGFIYGRTKSLIYRYMINKCSDIETDL